MENNIKKNDPYQILTEGLQKKPTLTRTKSYNTNPVDIASSPAKKQN